MSFGPEDVRRWEVQHAEFIADGAVPSNADALVMWVCQVSLEEGEAGLNNALSEYGEECSLATPRSKMHATPIIDGKFSYFAYFDLRDGE